MWYRIAAALALFLAMPAFADSWSPPQRETYLSPDGATRLTVIPREIGSQLAYFSDKVDGKEPAGQRPGGEPRARGILERRIGGRWTRVWDAPLRNEVAPVSALVANGGAYAVTLDNWHSMGFGENVVVIYRGDGSVVRSMTLTDILPEDYVRVLPTTVSSMHWRGEPGLSRDGRRLVLKVVVPNRRQTGDGSGGYLDVSIDLATGKVAPLAGPAWDRAMAIAAPLAARSKAEEADWRSTQIAPLRAPAGSDEDAWRRYLRLAGRRLIAEDRVFRWHKEWVMPAADDPGFAARADKIREAFADTSGSADLFFASPTAPDALARLLIEQAQLVPPGQLTGARLLIALPDRLGEGVRSAFRPTGAAVTLFDPAVAIPQRPEVLKELDVAPDAVAAEAARAAEQARAYEKEAMRLGALAPPDPPATTLPNVTEDDDLEVMADRLEALAEAAVEETAGSATPRR